MKNKILIYSLVLSLFISLFSFKVTAAKIQYGPSIATANARAYAIDNNGDLYYWGKCTYNDFNGDQSPNRAKPAKILGDVIAVYGNWWSGFAIKSDNSLWAVGNCADGKGGKKEDTDLPIKIMDNVKEVACAYDEWALLKTDGTVWYWTYSKEAPYMVLDNVKQISAGIESFYAIKNNGELWGWGTNYSGELGVKTGSSYIYPWKAIKLMDNVAYVHGAGMNAFAIMTDGTLWGWGSSNNILMNKGIKEACTFTYEDGSKGVHESYLTPVKLLDNVRKVVGRNHIAVIKTDNSLWVWGNNQNGELGDGTTVSKYEPQKLLDTALDVSAESEFTIVLKSDGTLWGCGDNSCGELGTGVFENKAYISLIKIMDNIAKPNMVKDLPSPWAKNDISNAISLGLVPEHLQTLYDQNITRREFSELIKNLICKVKNTDLDVLVNQLKQPNDISFSDTTEEDIINIAKLGIINGVGNKRFDPNGFITREQAAKILMNTALYLGLSSKTINDKFIDDNIISSWAKEGVYFCSAQGLMNGTGNNSFNPANTYTREMSIATILRLFQIIT
jgi:alpha-tubulin suppressor-like RCC1 family protein